MASMSIHMPVAHESTEKASPYQLSPDGMLMCLRFVSEFTE
jgi:hypothetical protein